MKIKIKCLVLVGFNHFFYMLYCDHSGIWKQDEKRWMGNHNEQESHLLQTMYAMLSSRESQSDHNLKDVPNGFWGHFFRRASTRVWPGPDRSIVFRKRRQKWGPPQSISAEQSQMRWQTKVSPNHLAERDSIASTSCPNYRTERWTYFRMRR